MNNANAAVSSSPFVDFSGKCLLVSGASSGIGQAIALELGRRGASLLLTGRNQNALDETAAKLGAALAEVVPMDLLDTHTIVPQVRALAKSHGPIYGLAHCAGVVETRPLSALSLDHLRHMLDVNLTAALELTRAVCRRDVLAAEGGSVLFISSIYGWVGMAGQIGYSASKGALLAAARSLAVELARRNVRVNTLSPGLVRTPMTQKALSLLSPEQKQALENAHPLGPGSPEDVARAAAFLLAPQNGWITGTDLVIDGGYTAR
jgi:NAD(P)-dependent dehydrogenase (short-subunit alcohol dehydrogenase family)